MDRLTKSAFTDGYDKLRSILIRARKEAELTQVELAAKLAEPQSFVSKYERGERRLDVMEFLTVAKAIGIDPHDILRQLNASIPQRSRARRQ